MAEVDGTVYVVGALRDMDSMVEAYYPRTDTWRAVAPMPVGLNHAVAAGVGGKLYVIGGHEAPTSVSVQLPRSPEAERLPPVKSSLCNPSVLRVARGLRSGGVPGGGHYAWRVERRRQVGWWTISANWKGPLAGVQPRARRASWQGVRVA